VWRGAAEASGSGFLHVWESQRGRSDVDRDRGQFVSRLLTARPVSSGLVQMQESLDREKKVRADVEKVKRKLETDLKATQEAVEELDRIKKELEDTVRR